MRLIPCHSLYFIIHLDCSLVLRVHHLILLIYVLYHQALGIVCCLRAFLLLVFPALRILFLCR